MKLAPSKTKVAFTLLEVLLSIAIFSAVLGAIYSSWSGILRAKQVAMAAAASAQRERMAMRVVEEALGAAQLYSANVGYYGFSNDATFGGASTVSVVARLPQSFPRSGKFGDFNVRRVTFSVEPGPTGLKQLVMRQNPILMELDEDEKSHPVVLADAVKLFEVVFFDDIKKDWVEDWLQTNQLPKLAKVSLQLNYVGVHATRASELVVREVGLPTAGVPQNWQVPNLNRSVGTNTGGLKTINGTKF